MSSHELAMRAVLSGQSIDAEVPARPKRFQSSRRRSLWTAIWRRITSVLIREGRGWADVAAAYQGEYASRVDSTSARPFGRTVVVPNA